MVAVVLRAPMKIMAESLTMGYGHLLTNYLPFNTNLRNAIYYDKVFTMNALELQHVLMLFEGLIVKTLSYNMVHVLVFS
jgi:hypothetical protein